MGIGSQDLCLHQLHFASRPETWGKVFEKVLPRHLQIVREINRRFVAEELAARWPEDGEKANALSIVADGQVLWLFSVVGSHSVNGVAFCQKLLKNRLLKDFADLYPENSTTRPTELPQALVVG